MYTEMISNGWFHWFTDELHYHKIKQLSTANIGDFQFYRTPDKNSRIIFIDMRYNQDMDKISFVILTWNSEKVIADCLESLCGIHEQTVEIILVDNGSTDRTVEIIDSFSNNYPALYIKKLLLEKNYGTTVSRNLGIREISDDSNYICILDSDTIINQDAVSELIEVLLSDQRNGIAGPHMVNRDGIEQVTAKCIPTAMLKFCKAFPVRMVQKIGEDKERYDFTEGKRSYPVGYLISACWMIKRETMEQLGPLDERIFYSPEDVEYCVRTWKSGKRVVYCPNAHIIHATQRISKKKLISKHNWEHLKGLIYFFRKYGLFFNSDKIVCK